MVGVDDDDDDICMNRILNSPFMLTMINGLRIRVLQMQQEEGRESRVLEENNSRKAKNNESTIGNESTSTKPGTQKKIKELKFICDQCGRGFSRQYNLSSHQKTHQVDKPFECEQCDAKFARQVLVICANIFGVYV